MKKLKYLIIGLTIIMIIIISILLKIVIDRHVEYREQEGDLSILEKGDKTILREYSLFQLFLLYKQFYNI